VGGKASDDDAERIHQLLQSVGVVVRLEEKQLDAVTGLSGSGPAFVYQVIEALGDAGVNMGLTRDVAHMLATQTVLGAAQMVRQTGEHPAVLKDRVASPGGTTIAGLAALEARGLRAALIDAVAAATKRSVELGRPK
jgi:pyrroline-5-carboxylate reductase